MVMMIATTITQKGQVTIPVHIREKLNVKTGQKVVFEERGDEVFVKAVPDFLSLMGSVKTTKKYNKQQADRAVGKYLAKQHRKKILREQG